MSARRVHIVIAGLAIPLTVLLTLEIAARAGWTNPTFVPAPSAVAHITWAFIASGSFLSPLVHTLGFLAAGYAIGCVAGIALGVLMGYSRGVFNLFEPLTEMIRPVPKPALLPPLVLFVGLGPRMEITIVALAVFFPVLINTVQGVRAVDPTMVDTARTFGYSAREILRGILLRASLPFILAGMRVSLGIGLILVVLAEMLSGTGGLGDVVLSAQRSFLVKESYAWLVVLTAVGFTLTWLFDRIERRLVFWH